MVASTRVPHRLESGPSLTNGLDLDGFCTAPRSRSHVRSLLFSGWSGPNHGLTGSGSPIWWIAGRHGRRRAVCVHSAERVSVSCRSSGRRPKTERCIAWAAAQRCSVPMGGALHSVHAVGSSNHGTQIRRSQACVLRQIACSWHPVCRACPSWVKPATKRPDEILLVSTEKSRADRIRGHT